MMQVLRARADVEVGGLVTTINEAAQRVAMHAVRVALLDAQATALDLPVWKVPLPSPCSNEAYERAMRGVVERAVAEGFTHVAFAGTIVFSPRSPYARTVSPCALARESHVSHLPLLMTDRIDA